MPVPKPPRTGPRKSPSRTHRPAQGARCASGELIERLARAEAELRTSRDSLSALVDASEQGNILLDTLGTVLAINQETARRLGLPREQIIGRSMLELLPPEVARRRREAGLKVIATGEPLRFEDDWDGRIYAHYLRPVKDADGQVVRLAVFSRDVTEQRSREHALRESQAKYRILFESTSDSMFLAHPDGRVQDANPAACELLGWSLDEIRAVGRAEIVHVDERFHAALEERARTGRFAGELTFIRRDGTQFPVEIESVLFPQEEGPPWAFTIFRDISAQRQARVERDTTVAFLKIVNASAGTRALAEAAAAFFQEESGCESIGLRLESPGGYPYVATRGQPIGFAGSEGRDQTVVGSGCPVLDCLCGKIIRGELGPLHPLGTRTGGFWTNHTSGLLGGPDAPDCMVPGRRRVGFESLALLPLTVGDRRLGLLELSDSRANRLTPALIPLWETLVNHLAVALARTQAEEALRASDERYRRIVETAQEGVWVTDVEGCTVYVNRRMVEIVGYDAPEEMIGRSVLSFLFPEDIPAYLSQVEARRRGESGRYELRGRRKDGGQVLILVSAAPLWDAENRYAGAFAMVTDITARKRAEEASRLFEKLASGSLDALCLLGRDYVYRAANDAMLKRVGRPREEVVGRHIADILGAEAFASTLRPRLDAALQGEVVTFAEWFTYPEEGRRFMEVTYAPYREPDGSISGIVAQARDISERKRSEEILQARLRLSESAGALSLSRLLQNAVDEAERLTGSRTGFLHVLDPALRTFTRHVWSTATVLACTGGLPGSGVYPDSPDDWTDCLRERRPSLYNDPGSVTRRPGLPTGHPVVYRELLVPVLRNDRVVAVMGVGNKEMHYDMHDVAAVSNLCSLLWDIILRKQAEEQLAMQGLVLEQALDRVIVTDLKGTILHVNRAACEAMKLPQDDLIGRPVSVFGSDPSRGATQEEIVRATLAHGRWRGEVVNTAVDGSESIVDCRTTLVRDAEGTAIAMCGIATDITARRYAEEALLEKALFQAECERIARMGGWKANPRTDYLEWSDGVREIIGVPADYKPPFHEGGRFFLPPHLPKLSECINHCLDTGEPFTIECEARTETGRRLWTEVRGIKAVVDGGTAYVVGTIQDITDRKKIEQQLAMQALVLGQAQDRVTIIGLDGIIRYVNRAQCQGLKHREEDLVGKPFFTLGDDPIRGVTQPDLLRSTLSRGEWRGEILHRASDGSESMVDCRTFLVRNADGTPLAICGIATDITERQRMEAALRESEARYRALVEAAPIPILVIVDGRCSYANPAALKLIGASSLSQVNRVPVTAMIAPEYREVIAQRLQALGPSEVNTPFEYEVLRMDGGRVAVESISMPIVFGGKTAALAIGQDISGRRQAEVEQREQHRRMQIAREEERRRIAREVHDELGQSLTALKIDLAWLRKKADRLGERIAEKIDSMDHRVSETLSAVQRISSELRPGILDALGLSAAIEWLVRDFETRTDIHCQLSIEPEEISIGAAPAIDTFRILQESLTNVARHSKASSVRVRLYQAEKELQLLVVDNGIGITEEQVCSRESIGLIGMRERVQVSGGSLRIHGLPGEGTLVRVVIPL